jgi:hypothetical protein
MCNLYTMKFQNATRTSVRRGKLATMSTSKNLGRAAVVNCVADFAAEDNVANYAIHSGSSQMNLQLTNYSLLAEHEQLVTLKLTDWPLGREAGLKEMFGDDWQSIGTAGQKRNFGVQFKRAVKNRAIENFEWRGIRNAGRYDVYRRTR